MYSLKSESFCLICSHLAKASFFLSFPSWLHLCHPEKSLLLQTYGVIENLSFLRASLVAQPNLLCFSRQHKQHSDELRGFHVMMQKKAPWLLLLSSFSNNATNDVFTFQDMIPGRKFSPVAVARQEATCARAFGSLTTLEMEPTFFSVLTLTVMIVFLTNNYNSIFS